MNSCAIGSLTYDYAYLLKNGRKEADGLLCKLSWLDYAKTVIDDYIPVGTLISTSAVNACGLTNTEVGFAPAPPLVNFQILSLDYNGNPVIIGLNHATLLLAMDDIIAALSSSTGMQWSYTQISEWEFRLCAPYTQNGDTVDILIEVFGETSLGLLRMNVVMSGGVAPEEPEVFQAAADNCITAAQYDSMVEAYNNLTCDVGCGDISKPVVEVCESDNGDANIELREELNIERREDGN